MAASVGKLPSRNRPLRLLEVGSWLGNSALTWIQAADHYLPLCDGLKAELLCVDPWELQDVTLGPTSVKMNSVVEDDFAYRLFLHNVSFAPNSVRVQHFRGTAGRLLPLLRDGYYDMVYVDGSHRYDDVLEDIQHAKRLLAPGGIICGDDLELQLHQLSPEFHEIARRVMNDEEASARNFLDLNTMGIPENAPIKEFVEKGAYPPIHEGVTFAVAEAFGEVTEVLGYWLMREVAGAFKQVDISDFQYDFIPRHLRPDDQAKLLQMAKEIRVAASSIEAKRP